MNYRLRILRRAESEVNEIFDWISERSPQGADRWLEAFDATAQRLCHTPFAWPLAPENEFVEYEIRHVVFKTRRGRKYRALYTIIDDEVRILHVRGGGQDVMDELGSPADD